MSHRDEIDDDGSFRKKKRERDERCLNCGSLPSEHVWVDYVAVCPTSVFLGAGK